jgi:hypothetical protein
MTQSVESPPRAATVRVILCVRGGVAEALYKPKGLELLIFDYDVDGADPVDRDPDGHPCCIQTLSTHEKVTANKHWPIVRTAAKKLNGHNTQQRWRCPQCQRTVHANPESLAEAGTPYCPQCDRDMEMI